mgnify:CR=1 FL=1
MRNIKKIQSFYGLNITEIMVALVILALAVITITGMFIAGIMGIKKGDNMVLATNLAQSTLELYQKEFLCNFDVYATSGSPYTLSEVTSDNMKFLRKMSLVDTVDSTHPINRLKKITISVYWYDKNLEGKSLEIQGVKKEIKFSSYIHNYLAVPTKVP